MTELHPIEKHRGTELPLALVDMDRGDLLLGYQQRTLQSASHEALLVIEKSRRIGLTWALAAHAVLVASAARGQGGKDALYISYSQDMTREFIDACAMWARAFAGAAVEVGEFMFDDVDPEKQSDTRQIKAFRITFASSFEIMALSSAPRSLRGKQGLLFIDEAAFVGSLAELLKAAMAFLIWGGQVIVVSTHDGADNPFNILIQEIEAGRRKGKTLRITFKDALDDGLYERVCLVKGETPTPEGKIAWEAEVRGFYADDQDEELDCIPRTGAGCWLPPEKIAACTHTDAGKPELYEGNLTTLGRDVSRRRDLSVIHATEMVGKMLWLRDRWVGKNVTFKAQAAEFARMMKAYKVLRAGIDQTGMGEKVVEDEQDEHGQRVHGVLLTPPNRLDIATVLKQRFEDETIRIPNDPALLTDLRAIKKLKGGAGTPQLGETGDVHADEFWALGLACLMADMGVQEYHGYQAAERRDGIFGGDRGRDDDGEFRMRADEPRRSRGLFGSGAW